MRLRPVSYSVPVSLLAATVAAFVLGVPACSESRDPSGTTASAALTTSSQAASASGAAPTLAAPSIASGNTGAAGDTGAGEVTGGKNEGAFSQATTESNPPPASSENTNTVHAEPTASVQVGGASSTGSSDSTVLATSAGPASTECTRGLLDGLMDAYFSALELHDPSSLPLADGVKFTENAEEVELGSTPFWMNAGRTAYSQRALDTTTCSVAAQAVIPEGATQLPVAIRLKVEAGTLSEIESIVVRPGDYNAPGFAVASDPEAIIAIAPEIGWHDEVPPAERPTREQLSSWIEKYFRVFPNGVCDVTQACTRLENGGGSYSCGLSCSGSGSSGFQARVVVVDEVRGIAAGLTVFDFQNVGHLDMHMVKMTGGQVHAVQAILRDTDGKSGWD